MQMVKNTAEALAYMIMVPSELDTFRMVYGALATTSKHTGVVSFTWGRGTIMMDRNAIEVHSTKQMAPR